MYEEINTTDCPIQSDTTENGDQEDTTLPSDPSDTPESTDPPSDTGEESPDVQEILGSGEGNPHNGEDSEMDRIPEKDPLADLASLRKEVKRLERELTERQNALERMGIECEEFRTLYPDIPLSQLGDDVWESVRRGVPIAAAHALSERRKLCLQKRAESENLANLERSPGALHSKQNGFFSYEEVRSMSAEEVRRNYHNIMLSMQKWGK
jgi:hypothetical protein